MQTTVEEQRNNISLNTGRTPLREIRKTLPLRVLSQADFDHWQSYGFVVIRQAVPQENVDRLVKFLWDFQEMDPDRQETWSGGQLRWQSGLRREV